MAERVVAIVQARMGSTRLPGKSMMDLAGSPLVGRVLERIKLASQIDELVLAIPETPENAVLRDLAAHYSISCFEGSEDNLLDRYYQAAVKFNADLIVRIPADNPIPHASEIDRIISHHKSLGRLGFSSNLAEIYNSGYPDGIGAEVFDFQLLESAWRTESDIKKLEHVHLNYFDYTKQTAVDENVCPISTIKCPIEFARPDLILDVNTAEQYAYMANLYEDLYPVNPNFDIIDIIRWHDNRITKEKEVSSK